MLAEIQDLTDETFAATVIESGSPTLVDFWGDHCPACRQISPILQDLAEEYGDRVRIVRRRVDHKRDKRFSNPSDFGPRPPHRRLSRDARRFR